MYKIKVKNNETGKIWWEYGFSKYMMKRIDFLFNDVYPVTTITGENFYCTYEVLEIIKIAFTLKTFKKCLTNKMIMV